MKIMFFRKSNKIFASILMLNICYIMFAICIYGPLCLHRSDIIYLEMLKEKVSQIRDTMISS